MSYATGVIEMRHMIDPGMISGGGGFEFPSFPTRAVQVGDSWNEYGELVQPGLRRSDTPGEPVYTLHGVIRRAHQRNNAQSDSA